MRYRIAVLTFLIVISFLVPSQSAPQTPDSDKPLYKPNGKEAQLIGSITVHGAIPKPFGIDMSADPICVSLNSRPETEHVLINQGALLNVFVYIKSNEQLQAYRFEQPDSEVVLHRQNCRFVPHLLALRVGQPLSIVNGDPTQHNTHPTPKNNEEWNQTQPAGGAPMRKIFTRPEALIPVKCNQHPWEKGYVAVMDHPFFALSDEFGNYEIRGLPPGTYTLVAWHEKLGEQQLELTVGAGESRRLDFTFDTKKAFSLGTPSSLIKGSGTRAPQHAAESFPDR